MAAPCRLLGNGITDDTLLNIACFIPTAKDLLSLRLTNTRFSVKCIAAPTVGAGGEGAAAAPEMLCIAEEAARLWVAGCSEQERGWVPRRELESWLCLMQKVGLLRVPLAFGRAHGEMTLTEGGAVATKRVTSDGTCRSAATNVAMRSGRYFASFTLVQGHYVFFGAIRPNWGVEGVAEAQHVDGHCFFNTHGGRRCPGFHDWKGMQSAKQGDRIGMLLDLDQGSMTVWKNDEKLGVMHAEGLSGPLCWAVGLALQGASARIGSAPLPEQ